MAVDRFDFLEKEITDKVYSRLDLYDLIYRFFPTYNVNSCNWVIGVLCQRGIINPLGKGYFQKGKPEWTYELSAEQSRIASKLISEFPYTEFTIIPSKAINALLGMFGGDDCLIVEVSKRDLFPCFMKLREITKRDVLLTPSAHELSYYMKPGAIVLIPLFSKSPIKENGRFCLEKLVVDLYCDRLFSNLYPHIEFNEICGNLIKENNVNITLLLNYAKRRRCRDEIERDLRGVLSNEIYEKLIEGGALL